MKEMGEDSSAFNTWRSALAAGRKMEGKTKQQLMQSSTSSAASNGTIRDQIPIGCY
jgi:hypothetical protein